MAFVRVGEKAEVPAGTVRVFQVDGRRICVANIDDESFYAVDDRCTHDGGPLGEGDLVDTTVECPRHGGRFDLKTGAVRALPPIHPIRAYEVKLEGDAISVDVGE